MLKNKKAISDGYMYLVSIILFAIVVIFFFMLFKISAETRNAKIIQDNAKVEVKYMMHNFLNYPVSNTELMREKIAMSAYDDYARELVSKKTDEFIDSLEEKGYIIVIIIRYPGDKGADAYFNFLTIAKLYGEFIHITLTHISRLTPVEYEKFLKDISKSIADVSVRVPSYTGDINVTMIYFFTKETTPCKEFLTADACELTGYCYFEKEKCRKCVEKCKSYDTKEACEKDACYVTGCKWDIKNDKCVSVGK